MSDQNKTNEQKLGSESAFPLHDVQQPWDSGAQMYDSIRTVITGGLTKRELFAAFGDQPGVAEIVTAAGFHSPDGFTVWQDKETKIGTFTDWWSKLSNRERFALSSKVRVEQADALLSALERTTP